MKTISTLISIGIMTTIKITILNDNGSGLCSGIQGCYRCGRHVLLQGNAHDEREGGRLISY